MFVLSYKIICCITHVVQRVSVIGPPNFYNPSRLHNSFHDCVFSFSQSQGHFWKEEGVKALSAKDYTRAIKLLSLALQFPNNSAELSYLVNNSLTTAYFETKQYTKAVEKGRECFKFKPTKSQVLCLSEI